MVCYTTPLYSVLKIIVLSLRIKRKLVSANGRSFSNKTANYSVAESYIIHEKRKLDLVSFLFQLGLVTCSCIMFSFRFFICLRSSSPNFNKYWSFFLVLLFRRASYMEFVNNEKLVTLKECYKGEGGILLFFLLQTHLNCDK